MRRISAAFMASLALAGLSGARADGYGGAAKLTPAPTIVDWSGLYIGGHVGYAWSDADGRFDFGDANHFLVNTVGLKESLDSDLEGWMGGGHIGLQHQHGRWVFGIEGTYDAGELDGTSKADWSFNDISCGFIGCFGLAGEGSQSLKTDIENLWTVTGRIGHTWERWLVYAKAGYASADISVDTNISGDFLGCIFGCIGFPVSFAGGSEERHDGWIIGAGVEHMVHQNVTLGFEYSYIDLGSERHTVDGTLAIAGYDSPAKHDLDLDPDGIHSVSARLTFLFNKRDEPIAPLK